MLNVINNTIVKIVFIVSLSCGVSLAYSSQQTLPIISGVGGDFTALNGDGNEIKLSDFKNNVVVLAFGYTNCADICPFTLGYLKQLYSVLSPHEQKKTQIVFVTVDPKYDTPKHLQTFVEYFNRDFIGLSGSQRQIDNITALYQAEYRSLSSEGEIETKDIRRITPRKTEDEKEKGSLFSHTVVIYLIDKQGLTRSLEYTGTAKKDFAEKIKSLINE